MILSSRQNPPKLPSLPPPPPHQPSYNTLSVASAIHLLQNSPLPSPSLPSILPRHGKKPPKLNSNAIVRFLTWLAGFIVVFWLAKQTLDREWSPVALDYLSTNGKAYEIIADDALPHEPTPVVVTDRRGHSKWTVSIPQHLDFPLQPSDYADICAQAQDVAQHVVDLKLPHHNNDENAPVHAAAHYSYYHVDPNYVDVADAQEHNLLPRPIATAYTPSKDAVCAKSLTYVLSSHTGGLAPTLMGLWLAWGLAQREGRAFFVDDSTWEYGNYSTFFQLPPVPACLPAPKEQRVPCPHQAAHLVVSEATTPWTFGAAFLDEFEDGREMGVRRLGRVFTMLRAGYEALWRLQEEKNGGGGNGGDVQFLRERVVELRKEAQEGGLEVGVHVRRGDRHPYEFQYSGSYVPVSKYLDVAREMMAEEGESESAAATAAAVKRGNFDASAGRSSSKGIIVVASDDPDVYNDESVTSAGAVGAQHRLWLTAAWGGGFFPELFWSLGKHDRDRMPKRVEGSPWPSRRRDGEETATTATATGGKLGRRDGEGGNNGNGNGNQKEAMELRQAVARAYLLDMAVLGQTDRVVCAVSSHSCRLLAVMMGWERAVELGGWRNVDGDWGWRGLDW